MLSYIIEGGKKLNGEVYASGSKNASLPILATSILNPNPVTFYNIPDIEDIRITLKILEILGCKIIRNSGKITISSRDMKNTEIPKELMHKLRSTVILAGAIIGRFKKAKFSYPGGCNIGARPIDLHLKAFKELGINVEECLEYINCSTNMIKGTRIELEFPSVGATENIILSSIYAKGTTHIIGSAKEPEIVDLAKCLNKMGAKIYGAGTKEITICGVEKLHSAQYSVMTDRIETGTLLCATAITKGNIKIIKANPENLIEVLYKLKQMGCKITINRDTIILKSPNTIKSINIETNPYPYFPTDMQPIISAVLTKAEGKSIIKENIFENRFNYCTELKKMGAKIKIENQTIEIDGTKELIGTNVSSKDLRGGAALVLAGLVAKGTTKVGNAEYILRGYEKLDEKLIKLGANIKLKKVV